MTGECQYCGKTIEKKDELDYFCSDYCAEMDADAEEELLEDCRG